MTTKKHGFINRQNGQWVEVTPARVHFIQEGDIAGVDVGPDINIADVPEFLARERAEREAMDPKAREMAELRRRMAQLEAS